MQIIRSKLSNDGRVLLPTSVRKQLNLHTGDILILRIENDELRISSIAKSLKELQSIVKSTKNYENDAVDEFLKMRKQEFEKEKCIK